jgi:Ligand-gated ion channel
MACRRVVYKRRCEYSRHACRCIYRDPHGELSILHGLKEAMWHAVTHVMRMDVFSVNTFPARLVTAAYAFIVVIFIATYTANLAAFLTVDQLDSKITSVSAQILLLSFLKPFWLHAAAVAAACVACCREQHAQLQSASVKRRCPDSCLAARLLCALSLVPRMLCSQIRAA